MTCANCCSTLGYVSDRDADTYQLYKHLLDCGGPDDIGGRRCCPASSSSFADHTCGSFLAREMVRYAESDAVFAFVVGLSDENDRTKTGAHPGECILLRILSWDTPMSTVGCAIDNDAGGGDTTTTTMIRAPFLEGCEGHIRGGLRRARPASNFGGRRR